MKKIFKEDFEDYVLNLLVSSENIMNTVKLYSQKELDEKIMKALKNSYNKKEKIL